MLVILNLVLRFFQGNILSSDGFPYLDKRCQYPTASRRSVRNAPLRKGHRVVMLGYNTGDKMVDNLMYPQDDRQFHTVLYNSSREPSPYSQLSYGKNRDHTVCGVVWTCSRKCPLNGYPTTWALWSSNSRWAFKNRCLYTIPNKVNVTYITLTETPDPWNLRVGSFPSVEPMGTIPFSDKMPFLYRFYNLVMQIVIPL